LQQAETGVAIKELCRQHGFSDASFYNWRAKLSGMTVPDAERLKELEAANSKVRSNGFAKSSP
jgi:putative transposase